MTDTAHRYPVRDPAPGPAVVLNLPKLWADVLAEMNRRGMTTVKELSDLTGLDRNTLGRIRKNANAGQIVAGQRGGVNVNALLTLHAFVGRRVGTYGLTVRNVTALTTPGDNA